MRVLILHASAGEGHRRAAEGLGEQFQELESVKEVRVLDTLDFAAATVQKTYEPSYVFMMTRAVWLWALSYYLTRPYWVNRFLLHPLRRVFNDAVLGKLEALILEDLPDLIVCTHFMPACFVANLKLKHRLRCPVATVVTDYGVHPFWVAPGTDLYCLGAERAVRQMKSWDAKAFRAEALGIPSRPVFFPAEDKAQLRRELDLNAGLPTVLLSGGGFGVGRIRDLIERLSAVQVDYQLQLVCGHNRELREWAETFALGPGRSLKWKIHGFVQNMHELLRASDLVMIKAGGLSVTEAVQSGVPILIHSALPGQEYENAAYVKEEGLGWQAHSNEEVVGQLKRCLSQPELLEEARARMLKLRHASTAEEILEALEK
ncbi:MAG: hypothetical protein JW937_07270 [Candidatus Omnitrophica bacterium]|nr:hypothetical protein [Candidatus Omnitrophota bacterium]